MTETDKKDDSSPPAKCPVNETWRHVLYIGGMLALHAGFGASAAVAGKSSKCPISEWGRHAVYTGGLVALLAMHLKNMSQPTIEAEESNQDKKWYEVCPVNQYVKHTIYVVGMVGAVTLLNSRKK